jgi:uncharacterized protein (DUF1786 family)
MTPEFVAAAFGPEIAKITLHRPHGTYWVAHYSTHDGENSSMEVGPTPVKAIEKLVRELNVEGK